MLKLLCTFIICIPLALHAQENKVDLVLKKNHIVIDSGDTLSAARKIYEWITKNIGYDWDCFYSRGCASYDAVTVINNGKAVCTGYATLFNDMCRRLGIRSGIIFGNARSFNRMNLEMNYIQPHSWNYLVVKDKWYLVDCTWGNNEQSRQFYFDAKPAQLIITHFPSEASYSLLESRPTYEQFSAYPSIWLNFFSNFNSDYRDFSNIKLKDSILILPLLKKPGKDILVSINDYGDFSDFAEYTYDPGKGMQFIFKSPGYYKISFYEVTKRKGEESDGECIFEMKITTQ